MAHSLIQEENFYDEFKRLLIEIEPVTIGPMKIFIVPIKFNPGGVVESDIAANPG